MLNLTWYILKYFHKVLNFQKIIFPKTIEFYILQLEILLQSLELGLP
jgi:hypothetical protein